MGLTFVQCTAEAGATSAVNLMYGSNTTAGSFLLVCGLTIVGGDTLSIQSDTHGNTWTQIGSQVVSNTNKLAVFWAKNLSAGALTVTLQTSTATTVVGFAAEYTGQATSSPIDTSVGMSALALSTSQSIGPIVTSFTNESIIIIGRQTTTGNGGYASTDGSTQRAPSAQDFLFDRAVSNKGSYTGSFTQSSDTDAALIVGVKSTTSSSGGGGNSSWLTVNANNALRGLRH